MSQGGRNAQTPSTQPGEMPSLIPTLPDYSGDLATRKYLTGDWGGVRTDLAENGILFEFDVTQIMQGNAHGGRDTNNGFRYSGSTDYTLKLDTARMGLWPAGLITLHGETQFGQSIRKKTGAILPPNFDGLLPVPDDGGATTLSEFYLTQGFGFFGRFGMSTGEANPFEQFYSLGVGGKGIIPNRDKDTFGIGYYLANLSDDLPTFLNTSDEQGIEVFYNIEIVPWLHVTPDLQVIVRPGGGFQDRDVAIVYGLRMQMSL